MSDSDWYRVKFLESVTNVKGVLRESISREPSTKVARQVTVCLQQGRMFYEAATSAPLEIRPLLIFYGMVGFAKALINARAFNGLETFPHMHGLTDISLQNTKLEDMQVKILNNGTFQLFNDTVSDINKIRFIKLAIPCDIPVPTCKSQKLEQKTIVLKEILSRIPGLESLYRDTFKENAKSVQCNLSFFDDCWGYAELCIFHPTVFYSRQSCMSLVEKLRERFSFLEN